VEISEIIQRIEKNFEAKGGLEQIYFAACGGSLAALYPSKYVLDLESDKNISVGLMTSNEFVHATPKRLGKRSLVVTCSHQGDTPETVQATKLAKERGATCITLTYDPDSLITKHADYVVAYEWGPDSMIKNQKISMGLKIAFELLKIYDRYPDYDDVIDCLEKIDNLVKQAKAQVHERAKVFAKECVNERVIYTIGSGASFAVAYIESICILIEMQWINSGSFHSGEFFHGPLEITDDNTPMLVLMSVGRTRPLDERVVDFLSRFGRKIYTIDPKELGIDGLPDSVAEFFCPLYLLNLVDVYNRELALQRSHPLSQRRYMWKVSY
jgi:fructoselysine 6-phosphate deglycase